MNKKIPPADETDQDVWTQVLEETFLDESYRQRWTLEGFADLSIEPEGDNRYLQIATKPSEENPANQQSTLWCKERFRGDLRFVFRARAAAENAVLFYFNARATAGSGHTGIFDWPRPDSQMVRYAGDENIEMYSIGMLREKASHCNLRYIGGTTAPAYLQFPWTPDGTRFDDITIMNAHASPYNGKPDTWFEFDVRVVGKRISLHVDGKKIFDVLDSGKGSDSEYAWAPIEDGGFIGLRNFRTNAMCVDFLRVYRKQ